MSRVHAPRTRPATLLLTSLLLAAPTLVACASPEATEPPSGESNLAPSFAASGPTPARKRSKKQDRPRPDGTEDATRNAGGEGREQEGDERPAANSSSGAASPEGSGAPAEPVATQNSAAAPTGPLRASTSDPTDDVRGGPTGAPDHVDLVGATVTRTGSGFEVRVDVAGALPARMTGDKTQNVAVFYDLDRDGEVDHETWGTLSDSGWSGSYRTPGSARFGADSGVRVRPDGATLVVTFPLSHLQGAKRFAWQLGSEWGTYEQVATGTTAVDRAAEGGTSFPG